MSSNNPSDLNEKQKELVNRLERIRQDRLAKEQSSNNPSDFGTKPIQTTKRRNENKQQPVTQSKRNQQQSKPTSTAKEYMPVDDYTRPVTSEMSQTSFPTKTPNHRTSTVKSTTSHSQKNAAVTEQLSDGKKLADAIVLSEILSKPVALRNRNR